MKAHVDPEKCTGCGLCEATCPEVFEMADTGLAVAKPGEITVDSENSAKQAAQDCPTEAISIS